MADQASKYAPIPGKIPGTRINLGGHELVLAPLALRQLAELRTQIDALGKGDSLDASVEAAVPIIHASLLRNYPDITIEEVRGLIDAANVALAVQATLPRAPGAVTA